MYRSSSEKNRKGQLKKNLAFYISLAVCLAAITGAAWTTYGNVEEYTKLQEQTVQESSSEERVSQEISGQSYEASDETVSDNEKSAEPDEGASIGELKTAAAKKTAAEKAEKAAKQKKEQQAKQAAADVSAPEETHSPVNGGEIITPYSPQKPVYSETMKDYRTHSGVDLSAEEGSAVYAIRNGRVKKIYSDPLFGNVISIEHDGGYEAFYCGLTDTPAVSEGSVVSVGDSIGFIGTVPSESAKSPHLHLEVTKDGSPVDPMSIVNK